jgi:(1->4)-alpha-D-glucan 1-alpha-D-glucosylmutase
MDYEAGLTRFVRGVLDPARPNPFLADFADFIGMLARPAAIASLAQLVLKLTVPGVPDIYQGGELWDFSLVDPDNRRPVDFAQRQRLLDEVSGFGAGNRPHPCPPPLAGEGVTGVASYGAAATEGVGEAASYNPPPKAGEGCVGAFAELDRAPAALVHELTAQRQDGREKLFVTARLLGLRRDHPELFAAGDYQPLGIGEGRNSDRLCAFARSYRDEVLIVVVPHLTYGLFRDGGPADFGITDIALPSPGPWRNVFTDEMLASRDRINATELFEDFPIAVLLSENS